MGGDGDAGDDDEDDDGDGDDDDDNADGVSRWVWMKWKMDDGGATCRLRLCTASDLAMDRPELCDESRTARKR